MSSTYFISDLHLDAARPHVTAGLAAFLQQISRCDALYILGDLFEAWVGDDDDSALALETTALLRNFTAGGTALYLMVGNRDFLLGEAFATATGATLLPDPALISLYGERTLLLHGDTLCTTDTQYQAFRATSRQPEWQARMLEKPLAERRELAHGLRQASHEAVSNKPRDITDVDVDTVNAIGRDHGVARMIHGHTHRPARHETVFGERWVLGDWDQTGWALEANPLEIKLNNFFL